MRGSYRIGGWILVATMLVVPGSAATPITGTSEIAGEVVIEGDAVWQAMTRLIDLHAEEGVPSFSLEVTARAAHVQTWSWNRIHADVIGPMTHNGDLVQDEDRWTNVELRDLRLSQGSHLTMSAEGADAFTAAVGFAKGALFTAAEVWASVDPDDAQRRSSTWFPYSLLLDDQIVMEPTDASFEGAGTLVLALWESSFTLAHDQGSTTYESGLYEKPGDADVGPVTRQTKQVVWMRLEGADVRGTWGGPSRLAADSATVDVLGEISYQAASGDLRMADDPLRTMGVPLSLRGSVRFVPSIISGSSIAPDTVHADVARYEFSKAAVSGDASEILVAGQPFAVDRPPLDIVKAGLLSAAFLAAAYGLYRWAPLGFAALYSRLEQGSILRNETRAHIYEIVRNNPGINARRIHRLADASWGTVIHHLHKLKDAGYVTTRANGRAKCYYENHGKWDGHQDALAILSGDKTLHIAHAVAGVPGRDQTQLIERTGLPQSTVSYHLLKLERVGLVTKERVGSALAYYPTISLRELLDRLAGRIPPPANATAAQGSSS